MFPTFREFPYPTGFMRQKRFCDNYMNFQIRELGGAVCIFGTHP